jgi:hypothetical protein
MLLAIGQAGKDDDQVAGVCDLCRGTQVAAKL